MPVTREQLEQQERQTLAPHAQLSAESRGRKYKEEPPEWRTHFQRDRDRVIHSRAFRRLEYKTQVFLNGSGDHYRTRLTHTIEVAAISRNIARALGLNESLAETIALAHDLGHSPFGHKGESVLNRLTREQGGFEHNRHSLRIVEEIEQKYPTFPGLNLSWEVREGLLKHTASFNQPEPHLSFTTKNFSLEAQTANMADEIAYYSHDLDDGLEAGLLEERMLFSEVEIWHDAAVWVKNEFGELPDECRRHYTIRCIIDDQVKDVVHTSENLIARAKVGSADDVRRFSRTLIQYSAERRKLNLQLRKYLYRHFYYHPVVHEPNVRAIQRMEELFCYFIEHPKALGEFSRKRMRKLGLHRTVCDYIAGMTDLYVIKEHERLIKNSKAGL
ncbi:MAG TPA: deoxyguanosinetriphosphate triphosphohydrolase [Verrucomicrobiae bacterium]|nr:deoxyguanosinetriphosphate triphosphohydrolase [Verrucomicrobiae bacterium]